MTTPYVRSEKRFLFGHSALAILPRSISKASIIILPTRSILEVHTFTN